jgi:transcriptional regulator with XRE-family HTH domain
LCRQASIRLTAKKSRLRPCDYIIISFEFFVKYLRLIWDKFFLETSDFISMVKKGTAIVERIDRRAAEIGTSRPELVEMAGIAKNSFANWSKRGTVPPADIALVIANKLDCSVCWLVTGDDERQEEYSADEKNLIAKYRLLDRQGRFEINALLEAKTVPAGKEIIPEILTVAEKKQSAG